MARAPADGYTLLIANPSSISVNPALNPKLSYSAKDLLPASRVTTSPLVVAVNPKAGISSIQELIASAKRAPGSLNYTSSGIGSAPHLGAAHFSQVAGVEMMHIPYKGGAPAIQSVGMSFWYGLFVPVGTPPEIIRKIFDAAQDAMQRPEVKAALAREGTEVALSKSPEEFAAFLNDDNRFWGRLVKEAGVKLD